MDPLQCPVCQLRMEPLAYEGKLVRWCENCRGHWLTKNELRHIIESRVVKFERIAAHVLAKAGPDRTIPHPERERSLMCPECQVALEARKYGTDSTIVVNRCPECEGVWLDYHELELVQMLIEAIDDLRR